MHPGPRDLERREHERAEHLLAPRDLELRPRERVGAGEHHVHGQAPAALGDEPLLRRRHHLGRRLPRRVGVEEDLEAALVDPHRVAHGLELRLALHRAGEVELDVERDELEAVEGAVVADGHDVVEPEDADAPPARVPRPRRDQLAGAVVEDLLELGRPVLADVARLRREHDVRLPVRRHDHVRVAMDDLEAGQVRHGTLEARVLAAGDDERVEVVRGHRGPDVRVPSLQLGAQRCSHDASSPLMSDVIASLSGVGTPSSRPKRAIPPFRKSISVARRASTSWSMLALWP